MQGVFECRLYREEDVTADNSVRNWTFNNSKVLEMRPFRFRKGELNVTFNFKAYKTFPTEKVIFMKVERFSWKGLVKVTFTKS